MTCPNITRPKRHAYARKCFCGECSTARAETHKDSHALRQAANVALQADVDEMVVYLAVRGGMDLPTRMTRAERQETVRRLIARGMVQVKVAEHLKVSTRTVARLASRIKQETGACRED